MNKQVQLDEDRKRAEAYQALAHPAAAVEPVEESISPILMTHDGEVYEEPASPEDDILEGLDVEGLDPRDAEPDIGSDRP